MLDEVGHLTRPVSKAEVFGWKQELASKPISDRAAQLHLWLGEWELAQNEQPEKARHQFHAAQSLTNRTNTLFGLAAYDAAIALFYAGAYQDAADEFHNLLTTKYAPHSFNNIRCALWLRHVSACAGYHAAHSAIGIPEPPRLDPLCGAAALAASLRSLSLPFDQHRVLSACRVTGEGSSLQDVLNAAHKLGLAAQAVTADDTGLQMLPKPLVAYVERDHFIAVVKADKAGVSYLCSDCGMWPGGRVDLTWKQWHTMNAGLYGVVMRPGSLWGRCLASLENAAPSKPFQIASASGLKGLRPTRLDALLPALRKHVILVSQPLNGAYCGTAPTPFVCQFDSNTPTDSPAAGGGGPSGGDPVNLATGEEEYSPSPDITVYNPVGPQVIWQRMYRSWRSPGRDYPNNDDWF